MNLLRSLFLWGAAIALACVFLLFVSVVREDHRGRLDLSETLLAGNAGQPSRIRLAFSNETVMLESSASGWRMTAPYVCDADLREVERLTGLLERTLVSDRISSDESRRRRLADKDFGFDAPACRITVTGENLDQTLTVGHLTSDGREVYVRSSAQAGDVLLAASAFAAELPSGSGALRSSSFLSGISAYAAAVEIRTPVKVFVRLAKKDGSWLFTYPVQRGADDAAVEKLLSALYAVKAERFIGPADGVGTELLGNENGQRYGFDSVQSVWVSVSEHGRSQPARFRLGDPVPNSPGLDYALFESVGFTVAVTNSLRRAVLAETDAILAGARFFNGIPDDISGIVLQAGETRLDLLKVTNSVWRIGSEDGNPADAAVVKQIVDAIVQLRPEGEAVLIPEAKTVFDLTITGRLPSFHVEFFRLPEEKGSYGIRLAENQAGVYRIAATNLPGFLGAEITESVFADKTILSIPQGKISAVAVSMRGSGNTTNRLLHAVEVGGAADGNRIPAAWLEQLVNLRAESVYLVNPSAQEVAFCGFAVPEMEISIDVSADDALRRTLLIGGDARDGGYYVMLRGRNVIYKVRADLIARFRTHSGTIDR